MLKLSLLLKTFSSVQINDFYSFFISRLKMLVICDNLGGGGGWPLQFKCVAVYF